MGAERVAASLTKTERRALVLGWCEGSNTRAALTGLGLTNVRGSMGHRSWTDGIRFTFDLTPLGLQVRNILKGPTDGK